LEEGMPHEQEMFDYGDKSDAKIIKEQQAQIQELKDDIAKESHMVSLLKQENGLLNLSVMQQNTSPGHPSSNKAKDKGKTLINLEEKVEDKEPVQKNLVQSIGVEIEKDKYWLGRVNEYLEKLLKRANKDTKLQKHMERHYFTRNLICKIRVKNMKKRLRKTLKKLKRRDSLALLVDAPLIM
jgi:hypothetical protein